MTYEEALALLEEMAPGDALWKAHSARVADVSSSLARSLAARGEGIDPEAARVSGLFHDLGRSRTHGAAHGWVGYLLLRRRGLARYGRGCVAHWVKGRTADEMIAEGRWSPSFVRSVFAELGLPPLTLEDKVVALADSLVKHDEIVSLEERLEDLATRYGEGAFLRRNAELSRALAREVEERAGISLGDVVLALRSGGGAR